MERVTLKHRIGRHFIPRLPVTRHVFDHVRAELGALWVRINNRVNPAYIRRRLALQRETNLSVNVGSGGSGSPSWVNLDVGPHANLALRYDCRRGLPLAPNSVARIRCEHFFEHLDRQEEVSAFLQSCFFCLQPGGILRIVVPDAGRYLLAYRSGREEDWRALNWDLNALPPGFSTEMDIVNHVFRQGAEHQYAYDFDTLQDLLEHAGFRYVTQRQFGTSGDPLLSDDLPNHQPYSLYVEATKE